MADRAPEMRGRAAAEGEARPVDEGREPVRIDVDVDAYMPGRLRPVRGRQDRRPPADRRATEPGELRALREELEDRFGPLPELGRQPARPAAGADRPGRGRRAHRRVPSGAPARLARRARLRARQRASTSACRRPSISGVSAPSRCPCPRSRRAPRCAPRVGGRARAPLAAAARALSADLDGRLCCRPCEPRIGVQAEPRDLLRRSLVAMVVIVGVAVGVGHPYVPSDDVAVIDDRASTFLGLIDYGQISKANFDKILPQTAKQQGLQRPPQPSDPQYQQLKDAGDAGDRLDIGWITGEAQRQGVPRHRHPGSAAAPAVKQQNSRPRPTTSSTSAAGA